MHTMSVDLAPFEMRAAVSSVNADRRTADVIFATPTPVLRSDYLTGRRFYEVLSLDPEHVDLSRLTSGQAPLLDSHQGYTVADVIGTVESARLERAQGVATVRFSRRSSVDPIFADVRDGILRSVSVGYRVDQYRETAAASGSADIPTRTATRWTPYEISLVPMGADPNARVRSASGLHRCEVIMEPAVSVYDRLFAERAQSAYDIEQRARAGKVEKAWGYGQGY